MLYYLYMIEFGSFLSYLGIKRGESISSLDFRNKMRLLPPDDKARLKLDAQFVPDTMSVAFTRQHPEVPFREVSQHIATITRQDLMIPKIGEEDIKIGLQRLEDRSIEKWWT